jgi:hypothetical protein
MKPTNIISVGVLPGPKEPSITQLYNYLDIIIDDFEKLYHGVLPGPKEPSITQLYNYIDIIIDDFEKLYHGVRMYTCNSPDHPVVVRAALLKIASDTPAARRVAGFLSHSSYHTCFICDAIFKSGNRKEGVELSDFSEKPRKTKESNRNWAEKWKHCKTKAEREKVEKAGGTRWSPIHRLEYFDPIK